MFVWWIQWGAGIPNTFRAQMVGICLVFQWLTEWPPFCLVYQWSGPLENRILASLDLLKFKEKICLYVHEMVWYSNVQYLSPHCSFFDQKSKPLKKFWLVKKCWRGRQYSQLMKLDYLDQITKQFFSTTMGIWIPSNLIRETSEYWTFTCLLFRCPVIVYYSGHGLNTEL